MAPEQPSSLSVRPRHIRWLFLLSALVGVVIWSVSLDLREIANEFKDQGDSIERLAAQRLQNLDTVLVSLVGLYHSTDGLDGAELSGFASELLRAYPFIASIYHMEWLPKQHLDDFLEDMREQGLAGYRLHGRDNSSDKVLTHYLPVDFLEPMTPLTGAMLGYDFAGHADLMPALDLAIATGKTFARSGIRLGKSGTPVYVAFKAIYFGRYPPDSADERSALMSGLVMLTVEPEAFMASLQVPAGIHMTTASTVAKDMLLNDPETVPDGQRDVRFDWVAGLGLKLSQDLYLQNYGALMALQLSRNVVLEQLSLSRPLLAWSVVMAIIWLTGAVRSSRRAAQEQAKASSAMIAAQGARFSHVVDNAFDAVITADSGGEVVSWNRRATEIFGYPADEVAGQDLWSLILAEDAITEHRELFTELLDSGAENPANASHLETSGKHKDGRIFPLELALTSSVAQGERILSVFARDISQRKRADHKIRLLAYYDTLTNLPNRQSFKERASQAIESAVRHQRLGAVLYLDLDGFKRINDTLGPDLGDQLLVGVADRLRDQVRTSDRITRGSTPGGVDEDMARLGGDEFTMLLSEIRHQLSATVVARRIQAEISKPFNLDGHEVYITPSIGIALFPEDGATIDEVLKNADTAMYHAKAVGKNNFQFYADEMNARAVKRLKLEGELRKALDRGELHLNYQPQIDIQQNRIIAAEALLRWTHHELGNVFPDQFIPIAEDTGMIIEIGEWVLHEACRQSMAWQQAGCAPIKVAVNLSPAQFAQRTIQEGVRKALDATGLPPSLLELEITENIIMCNVDETIATLRELRDMGIHISVDDFGTGYSSLSYLKRFPINALKIDRSFVKDIPDDQDDAAITAAIIAMAHQLNLEVVAEGIETQAQMDFLRHHGCEVGQGYMISKPVCGSELAELLAAPAAKPGLRRPARTAF